MATTFKELLNRALKITSEDQIDAGSVILTDDVHISLAEVCMELKEEVEDAHNWRALRQQVTVSLSASENSKAITESNERSRLIRIHNEHRGELVPLVFDITDASSPFRLVELDLSELLYRRTMDPNTLADPCYFALDNSGDTLNLEVYPAPEGARTIQLDLIIPQARLDGTQSADLATNISVPVRPITMALVRYILEERGEELGINSRYSEEREAQALRDAISRDLAEGGDDVLVVT